MPIDLTTETLVSLHAAAKLLPARRGGKRPHISCLYRWATMGCRGIKLETLQVGGTKCTSQEALQRFFERLTQASSSPDAAPRSPAQRRRAVEQASRELEAEGA